MSRRVIILSIVGICATALAVAYFCTLQKQNAAKTILITLADVRLGITTKNDFLSHMARFSKYKSSTDIISYRTNSTYRGVEYYVSNLVIGKYSMFRRTSVSISVFFDSNSVAHDWDVTIYNEKVLVTLENELDLPPGMTEGLTPHSEWAQWPESRALHQVDPQDLKRISTSCFTSWFGCDTSEKLLTGRN
jgi:hypothetical protein